MFIRVFSDSGRISFDPSSLPGADFRASGQPDVASKPYACGTDMVKRPNDLRSLFDGHGRLSDTRSHFRR